MITEIRGLTNDSENKYWGSIQTGKALIYFIQTFFFKVYLHITAIKNYEYLHIA